MENFIILKNLITKIQIPDTLTLFNRLENIGIDFLHNVNGMWSFIYGDMEQIKFSI